MNSTSGGEAILLILPCVLLILQKGNKQNNKQVAATQPLDNQASAAAIIAYGTQPQK
jgi:hypothetical protein